MGRQKAFITWLFFIDDFLCAVDKIAGMVFSSCVAVVRAASFVFLALSLTGRHASALPESDNDLHFSLVARGSNKDGSQPVYKNPKASIEDRVNDLLPRMTIEEKVSQM